MGRKAPMHLRRFKEERADQLKILFLVLGALLLSGCGELGEIGAPIAVTNTPLAERIESRQADIEEAEVVVESPEALAFADALESGTTVLFNIDTGPSGTALFAGPGRGYSQLTRLPAGADVVSTGAQTGEWALVTYEDSEGWVNTRRLTLEDLPEQELVITSYTVEETVTVYGVRSGNNSVNIRSGPDVTNSRLVSAPRGSELIATGNTSRHWVEVTYNGTTGWASGNFIDLIGTRTVTRTIDPTVDQ